MQIIKVNCQTSMKYQMRSENVLIKRWWHLLFIKYSRDKKKIRNFFFRQGATFIKIFFV